MKATDRHKLIDRINTLEVLTDDERSALLGLLRESKTYGLVWEDKPEDAEERLRNELPVLIEDKERALTDAGPDAPNHILIEGDNLEALATLAYTHAGKIDVIYIDPPYNTGHEDFIYNDIFVDSEDTYRHSKWLSFMSRRLRIAKKLLSERGIMFISIDDNEQANLKLLCDKIFGQGQVETYIWDVRVKGTMPKTAKNTVRKEHEYLIACYKSDKRLQKYSSLKYADKKWSNPDNDPRGPWMSANISRGSEGSSGGFKSFVITNPAGISFDRDWSITKEEYEALLADGRIYFSDNGRGVPRLKKFQSEPVWSIQSSFFADLSNSQEASNVIKSILGEKIFDFPKPTALLQRIWQIAGTLNSTILDFFAGSGTTLHAVMQLNAEDGGKRRCILCTNNENGICENVTYERNKRVIQGYTKPNGDEVAGLAYNNLRYYRTDFVCRSRSTKNMRQLVNLSTDMLCIKENLYTEQKTFAGLPTFKNIYRYFEHGDNKMLIIYDERYVDEIVKMIASVEATSKIKVYVFSPSEDPWEASFEPVNEKVELCALPQAIYNTYKRILPKRRQNPIESSEEEDVLAGTAEGEIGAFSLLNRKEVTNENA